MPRAMRLLPLLLLVTAALEIMVFVLVARAVGFGWAFLLVLLASMAGLLLLRREGIRAWRRFRAAAEAGRPPGGQVTDGVVGLAGAVLLAVPGLVTGAVGLALALPPGRPVARHAVQRWAERRMSAAAAGGLFGPR
ncbi:MAG TPA: FxsA family protein, partial [Micromonosporaceae bacterium]